MIDHLSPWVEFLLGISFIVCLIGFYFANGKPKGATLLILLWSFVQGLLAYEGFYRNLDTFPPRFILVLFPALATVGFFLRHSVIDWLMNVRKPQISTLMHSIRLPIELVLYGLYTHRMIPQLMTFEGRNFDIFIGISALFMGAFYVKTKLKFRLFWNVTGLLFVLFILVNAILSAELPFQQFAFDQPNRAVIYFPFVLLPATIVPLVIWTHLTDILLLYRQIKRTNN